MPSIDITPSEYKYYFVDVLTNVIKAEIPLSNVTYERALDHPGEFSGSIPIIDATIPLDLYNSTLPGKTALYILRDGICVWGGMIWSRSYIPNDQNLTLDGAEFTSYLFHRAVWQTLYYGSVNVYCPKYQAGAGTATVYTDVQHGFQVGDSVRITSLNPSLNGTPVITAVTPASFQFASIATLALSSSDLGQARVVLDSYTTTRDILGWIANDFASLGFANENIKPASILEYSIVNKQISPIAGSSPAASLATLTTASNHDLIPGQEINFVQVDANLNGYKVITSVPDLLTFTVRIAGTITVASTAIPGISTFNVVSSSIDTVSNTVTFKSVSSNIATLTTASNHGLAVGDYVSISNIVNNINYVVSSTGTIATNSITVTSATNLQPGQIVSGAGVQLNTIIRSITGNVLTIDIPLIGAVSGNHTYTQSSNLNGSYQVSAIPATNKFSYIVDTTDLVNTATIYGNTSYKSAALAVSVAHGLSAGTPIVVEQVYVDYNGSQTIASVPDPKTIRYTVFVSDNESLQAVYGGTIKTGGRAIAGTAGPFFGNADIGLFTDGSTTTKVIGTDQHIFRGSQLRMFGEILQEFSKDINGFEYRIDCDFVNDKFIKTFVFVAYINPPVKISVTNKVLTSNIATLTTASIHNLVVGKDIVVSDVGIAFDGTREVLSTPSSTTFTYYSYGFADVPSTACTAWIGLVHPVSELKADQTIFEYPGNIIDFNFVESAQEAATRMWVLGNSDGLDATVAQPYAASSATDLLGQGWPILDQVESKTDMYTVAGGEDALYFWAKEFLDESRPPTGTFTLSVNGSFDPQIGTYSPGDWCSVITSDPFIKQRLASNLEPRTSVLIRKISTIKVSVPSIPSFPEKVELTLIPEWREDRRNER